VDDRATRRLLIALALSAALSPLNSTMIAVALPAIGRAFGHAPAALAHALVTSYLVASISLQAPGGRLGDVVGHRRALAIGQWIFVVGSVLGALAPELVTLVAARVVMALGGAVIIPAATALMRIELPVERRGRAFGAFSAVMGTAAMLGPLVGGLLEPRFGFRAIFAVNVPVLLASAALAGRAANAPGGEAPARPERPRLDVVGTLLLAASLGAIVVGVKLAGSARALTLLAGGALVVPLVLHARRAPQPAVDLGLLRIPVLLAGSLVVALHNMGMYALLFLLPPTLERIFGLDAGATSRIVVAMMVAMVVAAPLAGRLADRLGARALALAGCLVAIAGMLLVRCAALDRPGSLVLPLVVVGVGMGLSAAPSQAAAMSAAPRDRSGAAAGLLSTMRYLGGVAGILVLEAVAHEGPVGAPEAAAELHRAADVFALGLVAATVAAAALPRRGLVR
jgi:MFS family permease